MTPMLSLHPFSAFSPQIIINGSREKGSPAKKAYISKQSEYLIVKPFPTLLGFSEAAKA